MGFKFRKRIKVAPGVTINLSKKGVSTTVGVKGLSVNSGKDGTYLNVGIPGTGLYDRVELSSKKGKQPKYIDGIPNIFFDDLEILPSSERPHFTRPQRDELRFRFNSLSHTQRIEVLKRAKVYSDKDVAIYSGWLGWLAVDRFKEKQYCIAILKILVMPTLIPGLIWIVFDLFYFMRKSRNRNYQSFSAAIDYVLANSK